MFSTDSSENSKVVPYRATNCVENNKNTNGPISCHHNIPPPPLYSSNTTMLSFNNVEQSYTRVVGQVYSRETVTTIYGDPTSSNCWSPVRSMEQIPSNSVENNPSPPINPLHLLLEASDQIQSNSGPDNNISVNTPVIQRETTSSQYSDVNDNSSRTDFMSCDPVPDQRLLNYNMNIDLMNANGGHDDAETIPA
ncbi:4711_t:CDS:2, partial [Racocetra persica]